MPRIRYSLFAALTVAGLLSGCGKEDGKPPPGASDVSPAQNPAGDFTPPDVSLGAPTDPPGGPSKPASKAAPSDAAPPAKQEK
jgi:hypothetical protein